MEIWLSPLIRIKYYMLKIFGNNKPLKRLIPIQKLILQCKELKMKIPHELRIRFNNYQASWDTGFPTQ